MLVAPDAFPPAPPSVPYSVFKLLHIIGLVLLVGNVTVTSVWKVFADRTGQPAIAAFATRMVIVTDWFLTLGGVALLAVGEYGMTTSPACRSSAHAASR